MQSIGKEYCHGLTFVLQAHLKIHFRLPLIEKLFLTSVSEHIAVEQNKTCFFLLKTTKMQFSHKLLLTIFMKFIQGVNKIWGNILGFGKTA